MARKLHRLIFALFVSGLSALAQDALQTDASPKPAPPQRPRADFRKPDQPEEGRRNLDKLPPEERQRLRENFQRFKDMPPGQQDALRDREQFRRAQMARDIEQAIRQSGVSLDADRRQVYALRYTQERRKIEEQLRKEMEEKRKPMLEDMVKRLKTEFSVPLPSPSPSATAK